MIQNNLAMTPPLLDDADLATIAGIVFDESGIILSESKKGLIVSRLGKRLRDLNLPDFRAYCGILTGPAGQDERQTLISAITTNVTSFFREQHHFDALRRDILPQLIDQARSGRRIRLWSAGCSTGEEPYSLAMTILDVCPDVSKLDILILATDIDANVINHARAGCYDQDQLRGISPALRSRFLRQSLENGRWSVVDDLRKLIFFETLNLHAPWPFHGSFDVIFCRNVTIYFDADAQSRLWGRFTDKLTESGSLLIGHAERVEGPAAKRLKLVGQTQYQRI